MNSLHDPDYPDFHYGYGAYQRFERSGCNVCHVPWISSDSPNAGRTLQLVHHGYRHLIYLVREAQ